MSKKYVSENYLVLNDKLTEFEEKYKNSNSIFGLASLGYPSYCSASRNVMFTGHLKQYVVLKNPDFPRVFTNNENIFGKHSSGYKEAKSDLVVHAIIPRYRNTPKHLYTVIVYNTEKDIYEIIEKKNIEDLTEKYGFEFNNEFLDGLSKGSKINKGDILYKSTSYDENMNYRMGKNIKCCFMLDNDTIEDAIVVSDSLAKSLVSTNVETIQVSLNDNDILLNLYGDNDNYQPFPLIGEMTNDNIVCCKRRIFNNQVLFDLKKSNLRKVNYNSNNDTPYYSSGGELDDIVIYCNKSIEEMEANDFNKSIIDVLKDQEAYWQDMNELCSEIIEMGKASKDINYLYKRSVDILDPSVSWRQEDSIFSNMIIEFTVKTDSELLIGNKLTGRYGNKGVVSRIRPDNEMPYYYDLAGNRVRADVIINSLGVVNRTNSYQLFEKELTFIMDMIGDRLVYDMNLSTKKKEALFYRFYEIFNSNQLKSLQKYFEEVLVTKERKELFFRNIKESGGMSIHMPTFWEVEGPIFERLKLAYREFDWIKPPQVYKEKWGREIPVMKDVIISDMFFIRLKQTSEKGFSGRSLGAISSGNVPAKSNSAKIHTALFKETPIRFGQQELLNLLLTASPLDLSEMQNYYRSNPKARRWLGDRLMNTEVLEAFEEIESSFNVNAQILNALLKTMGLELEFPGDKMEILSPGGKIMDYKDEYGYIIGTDLDIREYKVESSVKRKYENDDVFIGSVEEYNKLIETESKTLWNEIYGE